MEYYAAVPSRATRMSATRSRCKNRHPDDNYSFAPIAHVEIRRAPSSVDEGSPIRSGIGTINSTTSSSSSCSKMTILLALNLWMVLLFTRRQMLITSLDLTEMPHGEVLREMRQHLAQIALEDIQQDQEYYKYQQQQPQWETCTCQKALGHRGTNRFHEPLRVVVLGSSASTTITGRSEDDEGQQQEEETCPHYSILLEQQLTRYLHDDHELTGTNSFDPPFEIIDRSVHHAPRHSALLQGLLLDQLVDVHTTDILIGNTII